MSGGIPLVIDKSTLQSLSGDEIFWLGVFFDVVLTPPLFMEIRADLLKASRDGREPEQQVAILADKLSGHAAYLNLDHYTLCVHNLMGDTVEMDGRPIIGGAQHFVSKDGRRGVFIDEPPEIRSLRNWRDGHFTDEDWEFARVWREDLSNFDLNLVRDELSWTREYTMGVKTDVDVLGLVDHMLGAERYTAETLEHVLRVRPKSLCV